MHGDLLFWNLLSVLHCGTIVKYEHKHTNKHVVFKCSTYISTTHDQPGIHLANTTSKINSTQSCWYVCACVHVCGCTALQCVCMCVRSSSAHHQYHCTAFLWHTEKHRPPLLLWQKEWNSLTTGWSCHTLSISSSLTVSLSLSLWLHSVSCPSCLFFIFLSPG